MAEEEDNLCIDCSVLSKPEDRKQCEELTRELAEGNIDLETFSNALIDKLDMDSEKFTSVFCDETKRLAEEEKVEEI